MVGTDRLSVTARDFACGRDATQLGLTVLRTWAFADGAQWNAIQPSLGVLDERVLSEVCTKQLHLIIRNQQWAC